MRRFIAILLSLLVVLVPISTLAKAPTSIAVERYYMTLAPGGSQAIEATVLPKKATDKTILYASANERIARVDAEGVVHAVSSGTTKITLTANANPKAKQTITVNVMEKGGKRLSGLKIGLNPGHQTSGIHKQYPLWPGSKKKADGCKVGSVGRYTRIPEYKTNLAISLKLRDLLEAEGATVIMTRTTNNVRLTNIQRANMLNEQNVDVALQMHCNGSSNKSKNGLSGYIRTGHKAVYAAESRAISKSLTRAMSRATGAKNLGVKVGNGYMSLNWTTTPSVLLEMGYLSNKKEDNLLSKSEEYQQKMAEGIVEGLAEYFGR